MTADQYVAEVGQALDTLKLVPPKERLRAVERVLEMVQEWSVEVEDDPPRTPARKKP